MNYEARRVLANKIAPMTRRNFCERVYTKLTVSFSPQDKLINKLLPIEVNVCAQLSQSQWNGTERHNRSLRFIYLSDTTNAIADAYSEMPAEK